MSVRDYILPRGPLSVGFDDDCGLCQTTKRWAVPLLPTGSGVHLDSAQAPTNPRLAAVDAEARLASIHAAEGDRILSGFAAVSALLRRTVLGVPLVPALAVLEFTPLGEHLYQAVARRRATVCSTGLRR